MRARQGAGRRLSRILRYYYLRLVRIDDSPEKIAGGVALGIFLGVFPTFGLGFVLAVALASSLHVNKVAALLGSVIMNPITSPIFWGLSAGIGARLLGVGESEIAAFAEAAAYGIKAWLGGWFGFDPGSVPEAARGISNPWTAAFGRLGLAYLVGNLIVSLLAAVGGYFPARRLARAVHRKRVERRHRRAARRAERAEQVDQGVRPVRGGKAMRQKSPADLRPGV